MDAHPQKIRVADVPPANEHREEDGWMNTAVLIWCYGGAASLEEAGYIYEPD